MNREIKFRAWDIDNKKWIDLDQFALDPLSGLLLREHNPDEFSMYQDGNYELMQYTGLKDDKEAEVYEGDILAYWFVSFEESIGYEEQGPYGMKELPEEEKFAYKNTPKASNVVEYNNGGFYLGKYTPLRQVIIDHEQYKQDHSYLYMGVEVVGNIYQNPELLK